MPRVLLIDAEPHIITLLKQRFESEGFELVSLKSQYGLSHIADIDPDLIVLGKQADRTGITRHLLQEAGALPVPIIHLAAGDNAQTPRDKLEPDVAELKMPFRPSQLLALAHQAVNPV